MNIYCEKIETRLKRLKKETASRDWEGVTTVPTSDLFLILEKFEKIKKMYGIKNLDKMEPIFKDISSAPKDGTQILVKLKNDAYACVRWRKFFWMGGWTVYLHSDNKKEGWLKWKGKPLNNNWLVVDEKDIVSWRNI